MPEIDLNADLGEGAPYDEALLGIVSSANIACGGHAGDEETMVRTVRMAIANGVAVGAHPGMKRDIGICLRPLLSGSRQFAVAMLVFLA